ncbi:predicted protein [Nematostella vectensis]|uniref:Zinc finger CW-type PWWP domain protein 1 n=1 Tax=Nematostella vectensis TaxID=45351 RepID=A7S5K0_NEMVE|nr:predicted protein [Nematostella vectensis]|eukprot:XP_001633052.1 predicted protein [Nematostella vectensis]
MASSFSDDTTEAPKANLFHVLKEIFPDGEETQCVPNIILDNSSQTKDFDEKKAGSNVNKLGSWVQCSKPECCKWRFLKGAVDPIAIPERWVCHMNNDDHYNSCAASQEDFDSQDEDFDVIYSPFPTGAIVWAKLAGYPWWPAMMEDDPDYGYYYETDLDDRIPISYHVVFFGKDVSRAWVNSFSVRELTADEEPEDIGNIVVRKKNYKKQLDDANGQARQALSLPVQERLAVYGFEKRFSGQIGGATKKRKKKNVQEDESMDSLEDLPDSLESSEEFVSSGISYSSSQDTKVIKKAKKAAKKIAKHKDMPAKTKQIPGTKIEGEKNKEKNITGEMEKNIEGDGEKKQKKSKKDTKTKSIVINETEEQQEKNMSDTQQHGSRTIITKDKCQGKEKKNISLGQGGESATNSSGDLLDGEKEKVASKKAKKKAKEQCPNDVTEVSVSPAEKSDTEPKTKPKSTSKMTKDQTKDAEKQYDAKAKNDVVEKKPKAHKAKKTLDKKESKKETVHWSPKTGVEEKNTLPVVPTWKSPVKKPTKSTVKPLPKLAKTTFKPPSTTKIEGASELKPRKMPKLVKPFVTPSLVVSEPKPKVSKVRKPDAGPKVIVEHLEQVPKSQKARLYPVTTNKARKSAIKRIFDSDEEDEEDINDDIEAELANLDRDIEEMKQTLTESPSACGNQAEERLVENFEDSPEF